MTEQEEFEFRFRLEQERAAARPNTPTFGELMKKEVLASPPMAVARGVKDIVDTGALGLATLYDKVTGADKKKLSDLVTGAQPGEAARVRAMNEAGRAEFDKAAEGRVLPQVGRFMGNMAGVAPAVSALGGAIGTVAPRLGSAVASGGMTTGAAPVGALARAGDMGIRMAGGGLGGYVGAGMVDPESANAGGVIGAVAPPALKVAGMAGAAAGNVLRGPAQSPELAQAVQQARGAGYVIPPTQAKPTLGNRILEGFSGKITTAQNASAKNQAVTNDIAAKALGLPAGTKITPTELTAIRNQAGQAYQAIGGTGVVTPTAAYSKALDSIAAPFVKSAQGFPGAKPSPVLELVESLRSPSLDASSAVEMVKQLRTQADDAFRSGNTDIGRASRAASKALEDVLETHLQTINQPQLLQQFKDARQLIAKTYTVEKALNPASGSVDARKLAAELKKGKPLSGELKTAAEFGLQFPKAAQSIEGMGSLPQTSPLDWALSGSLSAATANPLMMAGVAARPMARSAVLSPMVQNRLVQRPSYVGNALMNPDLQQAVLRAAPLLPGQRQ